MNPSDPPGPAVAAYAAAFEKLSAATTGRTRRGPDGAVLAISGARIASLNAIVSPSREPDADEIAALIAAESPWELPWSIHVRGEPTPPVTELAAHHGLTTFTREPLMVRHPDQGPPPKPDTESLLVRPVAGDELDVYARTLADGFEAPRELFEVFTDPSLVEVDGMTFYLAELDGVPVGTGMTAVSGGLAGLFNITTLPPHRRRGHGRALTLELIRAGFAEGADTTYLYASEMGEPVYAAAGFRTEEYLTVITGG